MPSSTASHTLVRTRSATGAARSAICALLLAAPLLVTGCSGAAAHRAAPASGGWADPAVNAVSRPVIGSGVAAVTALRGDGRLETAVDDLTAGRRLWERPATMAGRPAGMGVQPPAVVRDQVIAVERRSGARDRTALVARSARTGAESWTRPVTSTFGPARCGPYVCLSESTADRDAGFVALDPAAGGRELWRIPGVAEVEWSDGENVVVFRMARHPALEKRELRTGRTLWAFAVERAVGTGVSLSGGWSFGVAGGTLVGSLAPYQATPNTPPSAYGFFGLRMSDGALMWARRRLLRVYPTPHPAVALIAREVDSAGHYAAFARIDPVTGRTLGLVQAERAPRSAWWLGLPANLSAIAFLPKGSPAGGGSAYALRDAAQVPSRDLVVWSFCTVNPHRLRIDGLPGFFPIAPLCAYDLGTGRRTFGAGAPPDWYTGAADGRRVWRDEHGGLHAVTDPVRGPGPAARLLPGMFG